MALINCPECDKEISDKANTCPHCGFPISNLENSIEFKQKNEEESVQVRSDNKKTVIGAIIVVIIIGIIGIVYYKSTEADRARERLEQSKERFKETTRELEELEKRYESNKQLIDSYED